MLTIFTPTYNRGYIISNLYQSLLRQSDFNFEWLVIDDGSTDDTAFYFENLLKEEHPFSIRYVWKENGGKHTAANLALELANGNLFFVVDSDDKLVSNSVERIHYHFMNIANDEDYCGVCGLKGFFDGRIIGSPINYKILDTTIIDYRFRRGIKGDKADVFRTDLLRVHRFPENVGEKWCPLSIVWNRFSDNKKIRYFNEVIYLAEYLPDGISLNRNSIRRKSPQNTKQYYKELSQYDIPILEKFKASVNYWRFGLYSNTSLLTSISELGYLKSFCTLIPGFIFHFLDKFGNIFDPKAKILKNQFR